MQTLTKKTTILGAILLCGTLTLSHAGASVQVRVGNTSVSWYDEDVCWQEAEMDMDRLIVVSPTLVGFWIEVPGGRWVMKLRTMRWDPHWQRWYYGPWYIDHAAVHGSYRYNPYRHGLLHQQVYYRSYLERNHRTYYHTRFHRSNDRIRYVYPAPRPGYGNRDDHRDGHKKGAAPQYQPQSRQHNSSPKGVPHDAMPRKNETVQRSGASRNQPGPAAQPPQPSRPQPPVRKVTTRR